MLEAPDIPGANDIVGWFGYWPEFHDAEVISIFLHRSEPSRVVVHAFEMTPEVDSKGHYALAKHAIITFILEGFVYESDGNTATYVNSFNHQNVVGCILVRKLPSGYELFLENTFGVAATISAAQIRVELQPGLPPDYLRDPEGRPRLLGPQHLQ